MLFDVMSNKNNPNVYKVNFETMVPYYLNYKRGSDDSLKLAQKIKNFYFGGEEASMETKENNYIVRINYDDMLIRCFNILLYLQILSDANGHIFPSRCIQYG